MKKKVLALCLVLALAAIAVIGTTLAYFTDTDDATNNFTVGNVQIDLKEVFDEEKAELMPGKDINKDVTVANVGNNDAYVWYTYAVPSALKNIVHVEHDEKAAENGWLVDWKVEENVEIDGVKYDVYTVLYNKVLAAGEETPVGMTNVYLDSKVDFDGTNYTIDGEVINYNLANGVKIPVNAYAIQAEGFETAEAAYNAYQAQQA